MASIFMFSIAQKPIQGEKGLPVKNSQKYFVLLWLEWRARFFACGLNNVTNVSSEKSTPFFVIVIHIEKMRKFRNR